jgi:pimeloyl-ACP methyl ester carboxylesterase
MSSASHDSQAVPISDWSREDLEFESQGERCAAWLYRPQRIEPTPVMVMAHGFAAERSFGLPAFAERFAGLGFSVMVFDYRCFGDSEGMPRNWVSPRRHNQDWDAAIEHARHLDGVDPERLVLWGTSFSGGHVLATAARRGDVAAIIAQVPFVDSRASDAPVPRARALRSLYAGLRDGLHMLTGRSPHCVPVIGRPDEFAILNTPECEPGYRALVPEGSSWINQVPARILLSIAGYRPSTLAGEVRCPALLVLAERDSLIPAATVARTAARIADCRLERLPCGHFEPYVGEWFEKNVSLQQAFLRERVLAAAPEAP